MSIKDALFNPKIGAIKYFPSNTIISSMKVLIESSKKGPLIASRTMLNVAEYIKEIHRVNERLNDLMSDIISSMKQQISFMAPVIAGVVVAISSMIVTILTILKEKMTVLKAGAEQPAFQGLMTMFGDGVPSFYLQIIVGLYVVEIVYILTILVNSLENGDDKLSQDYLIGQNMMKSTIIYTFLAMILTLMFNLLVAGVLKGSAIGT
jgi:hypothetical protein